MTRPQVFVAPPFRATPARAREDLTPPTLPEIVIPSAARDMLFFFCSGTARKAEQLRSFGDNQRNVVALFAGTEPVDLVHDGGE